MNTKNKLIINQFFKEKFEDFNKSFLINANDDILLDKNDSYSSSGIYFKLNIKKQTYQLVIDLFLYSWSNEKQTYVPLEKSIWSEDGFGSGKYIPKIEAHYKNIVKNFLNIFKQLKYYWQLKEIIHKLENPTFIFHYKLLNTFSKEILENLMLKYFEYYPKLNISLSKNPLDRFDIAYVILPDYIDGFYLKGIEVSVDSNKSDFADIETESGVITADRFLEIMGI